MPSSPLSRLFDPRAIAVVGASANEEKPGFQILRALEPFHGAVYPVNPRGGAILGRPVHRSLGEVPGPVDLVALVLPARHSLAVLEDAASVGAGAAFMVSGGFGETGDAGAALETDIAGACLAGGIRLLGPNTSGFLRPSRGLACTFLPAAAALRPGPIGIVAQSGGINLTLAMMANAQGLGVSLAVGLGNAADLGVAETLNYLAADPETRAIVLHLEGVADGRAVFDAVRAAVPVKPVVALPVGRADLAGFAESHTGALMGNHRLTCAALRQAGAAVVETLDDALDAAYALSVTRLNPARDPGIGVLTGQAGPGLLMTDTLRQAGVSVPELAPATVARIAGLLPPLTYMKNPVDTGRPDAGFGAVMEALAADGGIDAVLAYALIEGGALDVGGAAVEAAGKTSKPAVFATAGVPSETAGLVDALRRAGIPVFLAPDRAARAMAAMVADARHRAAEPDGRESAPPGTAPPLTRAVDEDAAKTLVSAYGIPTPKRAVCRSRAEAEAARAAIAGPVVAKVLDPGILHKSDVGGVHVGIETAAALEEALDAIERISNAGYLIEAMAPDGLDLILGARNDPSFGPTVLLGLGGTAAEAVDDVAVALAPLGAGEVDAMIDSLAGSALFGPWRGAPAPDRAAIREAVLGLARLIAEHPEIAEIDLNPVRAYAEGAMALDALIVLRRA
ncbi:MAG: acetate--CoA ligase family protein [Defluviicoccus sp.]|nr:acetate--CoA ligase family protein [Defluviicoccus sp.]MDE0276960.1 acetate--CoA ligase family protein [Defluviicoccus sp.]